MENKSLEDNKIDVKAKAEQYVRSLIEALRYGHGNPTALISLIQGLISAYGLSNMAPELASALESRKQTTSFQIEPINDYSKFSAEHLLIFAELQVLAEEAKKSEDVFKEVANVIVKLEQDIEDIVVARAEFILNPTVEMDRKFRFNLLKGIQSYDFIVVNHNNQHELVGKLHAGIEKGNKLPDSPQKKAIIDDMHKHQDYITSHLSESEQEFNKHKPHMAREIEQYVIDKRVVNESQHLSPDELIRTVKAAAEIGLNVDEKASIDKFLKNGNKKELGSRDDQFDNLMKRLLRDVGIEVVDDLNVNHDDRESFVEKIATESSTIKEVIGQIIANGKDDLNHQEQVQRNLNTSTRERT